MRVRSYVYDGESPAEHVPAVLERLADRAEDIDVLDVADAEDRQAARREAMLTVRAATRIGTTPDALFDAAGEPDFSAGALVTEAPTGRRELHVGADALAALRETD